MPPTIFKGLPIAPLLALALTVVPLTCAATIETLTSPTLEIAVSQTGGTTFSDNLTKRNKSQRMAQNYAKDPTTFDASAQKLTSPFQGGTKPTLQGAGSRF
jgi:hypothetical protein